MVTETSRFALDTYTQGEDTWSHTDTVEFVDEHAIDTDTASNRPSSGTYDDELYLATDDDVLYRWNQEDTSWKEAAYGKTASPTWTSEHQFNASIQIAEGQSISDGTNDRININSSNTQLNNDAGNIAVNLVDGIAHKYRAYAGTPWVIYDQESGLDAVQYDTDASAGILHGINASIAAQGNSKVPSSGTGVELYGATDKGIISGYDRDGGGGVPLEFRASLYDFSNNPADLRLNTGQAIEDGSGTSRLRALSDSTIIDDDAGSFQFLASSTDGPQIKAPTATNYGFRLRDAQGSFTAVQYTTSASAPGTLELTNANLDVNTGVTGAITDGSRFATRYEGGQTVDSSNTGTIFSPNNQVSRVLVYGQDSDAAGRAFVDVVVMSSNAQEHTVQESRGFANPVSRTYNVNSSGNLEVTLGSNGTGLYNINTKGIEMQKGKIVLN
jgi:hypothetical protein